jgi:myo-inositol-1-phosphate synthase
VKRSRRPGSKNGRKPRLGVWLLGAHGNVAVCAVAGARAVARGLLPDDAGLVTEGEEFRGLGLAPLGEIVFGGHEVRKTTAGREVEEFDRRNGLFPEALRRALAADLRRYDTQVRPGVLRGAAAAVRRDASKKVRADEDPARAVARVRRDLRAFRTRNRLDGVVAVNVASTEPAPETLPACLRSAAAFEEALRSGRAGKVPASVLYAWAAVEEGVPHVNFTPSPGCGVPAVRERALARGVPHMGRDGKTGETLLKTALAPMFVARRLRVLSWAGYNMLGNRDGLVLEDPASSRAKLSDKDGALRRILRDPETHTRVRIDYVPSLDDWKTAMDFIHFRGFLGAKMALSFTWQGCDSALAAPLVLDLARLADLARRRGEKGTLPWLAPFFKSPLGVEEQDFGRQVAGMMEKVREMTGEPG